ncbi:hypothetical protein CIB84_013261 [Bambusicola thoracicus]|uniref:Uncharacterized protein n=1 Tax=Bambusicola thoracicus TaxID=9083 RepID=A0A2P4SFW8_BAMTH|nr:hypothetical protein CIB84_013261 [Bambusicola thoracicus]
MPCTEQSRYLSVGGSEGTTFASLLPSHPKKIMFGNTSESQKSETAWKSHIQPREPHFTFISLYWVFILI